MQNKLPAMLQKEEDEDAIIGYYWHNNARNAQKHLKYNTLHIAMYFSNMYTWERKDGIENHEFIFNSYDALMIIVR